MKLKKFIVTALILSTLTILTACSSSPEVLETPDLSDTSQAEILTSPDIDDAPAPATPSTDDDELSTPSIGEEEVNEYHLGTFTATTITGEEITDKVFEDYDVTMVNVWATWCSPCVKEMPYLQELYAMLPDNANLVTICNDASTQEELALAILDDAGAEFDTIISNEEINSKIMSRISAFPTSIFVDRNGEIIHAVEGVPNADSVADVYFMLIEEILTFLNEEFEPNENQATA